MEANAPILAIVLIVVLAGDAIACAIPIKYIKDDLTRLNCSEQTQRLIPLVKAAAVAGLLIGLWVPAIGLAACVGMVAYFVCALAVHKREGDEPAKYVPAVLFMLAVLATLVFSYASAL